MPGVTMWSGLMSPGIDQMLDLGDGHFAGGRHRRIKIARRLAVDEIALGVAPIGMDDRQIGDEPALHHVALAVEFARLLAFGDLGAVAGLGEERRDAGAAGADALGQRALRIEFDFQLAGEKLLHERLVLPHIGGDHFLDLAAVEQHAQPSRRRFRNYWKRRSGSSRPNRGWQGSRPPGCRTGRTRRP